MQEINKLNSQLQRHKNKVDQSLFLYAILGNLVLDTFFLLIGQSKLAVYSMVAIITMLLCYYLIGRAMIEEASTIGFFTVIYLVCIWEIYFGWDFGAHNYLVLAGLLFGITENLNVRIKVAYISILTLVYFGLLIYLRHTSPIASFPQYLPIKPADFNTLVSFGAAGFGFYRYRLAVNKNETNLKKVTERMTLAANTDELTNIANRRQMRQLLASNIMNFDLSLDKLVIGLIDVDDFKQINDRFGHDYGDEVLIALSQLMKNCLRESDSIGRWGGEEFLIYLPDTTLSQGKLIIDRLRKTIAETPLLIRDTQSVVTITVGLAEYHPGTTIQEIITLADRRLYAGKESGKNCVVANDASVDHND